MVDRWIEVRIWIRINKEEGISLECDSRSAPLPSRHGVITNMWHGVDPESIKVERKCPCRRLGRDRHRFQSDKCSSIQETKGQCTKTVGVAWHRIIGRVHSKRLNEFHIEEGIHQRKQCAINCAEVMSQHRSRWVPTRVSSDRSLVETRVLQKHNATMR